MITNSLFNERRTIWDAAHFKNFVDVLCELVHLSRINGILIYNSKRKTITDN